MSRRSGRCERGAWLRAVAAGFAVASIVVALSVARAAQPLTGAALSGPVTVSTADGHVIKGTVQSVTPELLTVLPTPRPAPKARPGATPVNPPDPDPVKLPWADVKRTSDGLTARLALDIWEAQHKGQLCPTCRGERTVWCPVCKGTNHDPAAAVACKTCHGELLVACKSKGEADGVIGCPNGCLRLSVGSWAKHADDGEMWCSFHVGNGGTQLYSEHHIGHVILLDLKAHSAPDTGTCPVCGGTTKVDDPVCHGTGHVPCPECLARKSAGPCPNHCDGGRVECPDCGGTGLKKA